MWVVPLQPGDDTRAVQVPVVLEAGVGTASDGTSRDLAVIPIRMVPAAAHASVPASALARSVPTRLEPSILSHGYRGLAIRDELDLEFLLAPDR